MNTNIFKNRILTGVALAAALLTGSSCEDKVGLQVTPEAPNADKTLYEVITNDKDLTNFVEILNACDLCEESSVADSLFNKARVYTVWAPTNAAIDDDCRDSIIARVKEGYRDDVMKTFVTAHVANHLRAAKGIFKEKEYVLMLNEKMEIFDGSYKDGYTFAGAELVSYNDRVWNGILHKIGKPVQYRYNIWERLLASADEVGGHEIDSVANFLYSYDVTEFNEGQSILGPIENGQQTYLDSVFVTTNKLLNVHGGVGLINAEDSTYTMYVPTNDVWSEMLAKAKSHFVYSTNNLPASLSADVEYIDSIMEFFPKYNLVKYLTFSDIEQQYAPEDSMMPANRDEYNRVAFPIEQINSNVVFEEKLSNGTFKIVNKYPYNMFELWHDTIKVEGENNALRDGTTGVQEDRVYYVNEDKIRPEHKGVEISGDQYYEAYSPGSDVEIYYKIPEVRSASYKIALVTVPKNITDSVPSKELRQLTLTCTISQAGSDTEIYKISNLKTSKDRLDTLYLPNPNKKSEPAIIKFPYCEFYNRTLKKEDYSTRIMIKSSGISTTIEKSIRLDAILLIPVEDAE